MKVTIAGGTGYVGRHVTQALVERGYTIHILSSKTAVGKRDTEHITYVIADTTMPGKWQDCVADSDIVINLAGRSVFHLWSSSYKKKMYSSRIDTTRNIVDVLDGNKTSVLLNASAAGYYGNSGEKECIESDRPDDDFLADICSAWENEAFSAERKGVRVVAMRFGIVLGRDGGAFATMKTPFLFGGGGPIGNGKQYFPWIHMNDLVAAMLFLFDNGAVHGPCNFVAPETVRQKEFAKALGTALKRPAVIPAPAFLLRVVLGEFGSSLLGGQKVIPQILQDSGFHFSYPTLAEALKEIVHG